jgi:hypothetical protein
MRTRFITLLTMIAGVCVSAFGQSTPNNTTPTSNTDVSPEQAFKDLDKLMTPGKLEALHKSTERRDKKPVNVAPALGGIREFRDATSVLRQTISGTDDLKQPLKDLEKAMKPIGEYFEELKLKAKPVSTEEFKDYSPKDILWETLTTAERIDNNLQLAKTLLQRSQSSNTVSIQAMLFYENLHSEFARLRWLANKTQQVQSRAAVSKSR